MEHANYDEFWKARNLRPHLKNISPPCMTVGGWFDAEDLFGAAARPTRPSRSRARGSSNMLVMGRGRTAAGRAATASGSATCASAPRPASFYREQIELPFFEHHLKDKGDREAARGARCSRPAPTMAASTTPGRRRNATTRALYLHGGRHGWRSSRRARRSRAPSTSTSAIRRKPGAVPGQIAIGMAREYMTADQRFAARGPTCSSTRRSRSRRTSRSPGRSRSTCTSPPPAPTPTGS